MSRDRCAPHGAPYAATELMVPVAGFVGPGQPVAPGFKRCASVMSACPRTWLVTRTPYVATSQGGGPWNPTFNPGWPALAPDAVNGGRGRVTWGDGQVAHVAEYDWGRGGHFVVHASHVEVDVIAETQAFGIGPIFPLLSAGATIVPAEAAGVLSPSAPLTLTKWTGIIAGAAFATLTVPDRAVGVRWMRSVNTTPTVPPTAITCELSFSDDPLAGTTRGSFVTTDNLPQQALGGVEVPVQARFLHVTNHSFADTMELLVIFELDLG